MLYQERTYVKRLEMEFTSKLKRPLTDNEKSFLSWLDKKRQAEEQIDKRTKGNSHV